jgi:hypothetical protein
MVPPAPLPLPDTITVVQAHLRDIADALDHLSDCGAECPDLARKVETWGATVQVLRNAVRQEIREALDREVTA